MSKIVSISTARKRVMGQIEVDGVKHDVMQLDFGTNQMLTDAEGTAAYLPAVRSAIRVVCPSLSQETVDAMGIEDGSKIVLFAGAGAKAVEAMFPNADSPETPTSPG